MTRSRRLAVALVVLAGLAISSAALLDFTLSPNDSLDPHRTGFAVALGFAVVVCLVALWRLRAAAQGRPGGPATSFWFALAVLALCALVVVAFASRLGG